MFKSCKGKKTDLMVGNAFSLIEFEICGFDVIDILNLENGIHPFRRKSKNSKQEKLLSYSCSVQVQPKIVKKSEQILQSLKWFFGVSQGIREGFREKMRA